MHLIILACITALATARPSYIAVPADQIAFLDLSNLHVRVPRQTLSPPPPPPQLPQAFYDEEYQPVALPQYQPQRKSIAFFADQIAFLDLFNFHVRVPQQTLSAPLPPPLQLPQAFYDEEYQPVASPQYQPQPIGLAPPSEQQLLQQPIRVANIQQRQQYQQQQQQQQQQEQQDIDSAASLGASQRLAERPPDFGEYVDFGAHTGDNGAFGWYADYPINQYSDHSRY